MNLLVTGAFDWTEDELNTLKGLGHEIVFMQQEQDDLPCESSWIEGIIGNGIFLSHSIEEFSSLRYIQLTSVGFDRVPMDYLNKHNIKIYNAGNVYSVPIAEFVLKGVLELYKQSRFFIENQKMHKWIKNRNVKELNGKTVCIVGCGKIGTECALRFKAFGCHVVGVDLIPYLSSVYESMVSLENFENYLMISDVVVLALPLTEQTKHIMNAKKISKLKQDTILVNISRGGIIDNEALIEVLKMKRISAVLDVFEEEPLEKNSPLWDLENVVISPHNSFVGDGNHKRMLDVIYHNLKSMRSEF